ncbi:MULTISPECIES: TIM barrel protein [Eisenbergiella]|uniref:TIM barrel protein n=1 Tax=Eisenbergiella porci TaxID=2652274 RepID=A0A6N7W6R4_9FIRM|nr:MULTISPECIES: TIM barrel protein [Eisenbergiella]MDY2655316.1 TIM barrel protein [Eisenbergiella porci]MSS90961.1 TIM barrel protein [Eisenbergiella porci]
MEGKKLNYSVCIDAVFRESKISFTDAMYMIHQLGYAAYEFWSWKDKDILKIKKVQDETGLKPAAFCTEFINPGDPENQGKFIEGLKRSIDTAVLLDCRRLIVQAGWEYETAAKGITRQLHRETFIETMGKAGKEAAGENIELVIEPLNLLVDHPGYHLSTSADAFDLINKIGKNNVKILYDIYHQQITEGNLYANIFDHISHIGHFHAAAVPGRGPITTGEIHYPFLLNALAEAEYQGYIGLEYMTVLSPEKTLKEVAEKILI